jgi:hypothetical protein
LWLIPTGTASRRSATRPRRPSWSEWAKPRRRGRRF